MQCGSRCIEKNYQKCEIVIIAFYTRNSVDISVCKKIFFICYSNMQRRFHPYTYYIQPKQRFSYLNKSSTAFR